MESLAWMQSHGTAVQRLDALPLLNQPIGLPTAYGPEKSFRFAKRSGMQCDSTLSGHLWEPTCNGAANEHYVGSLLARQELLQCTCSYVEIVNLVVVGVVAKRTPSSPTGGKRKRSMTHILEDL